jgi:hypothetical protein
MKLKDLQQTYRRDDAAYQQALDALAVAKGDSSDDALAHLDEVLTMTKILPFPSELSPNAEADPPITEANVALANVIGDTVRAWLVDNPGATRDDIVWALRVVEDCVVT